MVIIQKHVSWLNKFKKIIGKIVLKRKTLAYTLVSVLIIAGLWFLQNPVEKQPDTEEAKILFKDGEATDHLVELLGLTGIQIKDDKLRSKSDWPEPKFLLSSRKLNEITPVVQGKADPKISWFIPKGKERWQNEGLGYITFTTEQAKKIIDFIFKDLKMGESMYPKQKEYKGVLFLGTSLEGARGRLKFLNHVLETKPFQFEKVYLLTGVRPLDKSIGETDEDLLDSKGLIAIRSDWKKPDGKLPDDEGAMIQWVFDQSRSEMIKKEQVVMVYAPADKQGTRATTLTTIVKFLELKPEKGVYLAVSDQPYNLYQLLVLKNYLAQQEREDIEIEIIGEKRPGFYGNDFSDPVKLNKYLTVLLDNISRICYGLVEEQKIHKK